MVHVTALQRSCITLCGIFYLSLHSARINQYFLLIEFLNWPQQQWEEVSMSNFRLLLQRPTPPKPFNWIRFEYKTTSERYLVAKQFWVFQKKFRTTICFKKHQISLRGRFVFKMNVRISCITSYKDHPCSFFTNCVIKARKKGASFGLNAT